MPEVQSESRQTTSSGNGATEARDDPYAAIVALARSTSSRHAFMTGTLRIVARAFASPYAAIQISFGSEVLDDDCHSGPTDPAFWRGSLQQFLTDSLERGTARARLLKPKRGTTKVAFLSAPILNARCAPIGALAMVVAPIEEDAVAQRLGTLESLTSLASHAAGLLDAAQRRDGAESPGIDARMLGKLGGITTAEQLAFAITNSLRTRLGCELAAMGLAVGRRVKILSVSGLDRVANRNPGIVTLRGAMEECADFDEPIVCQSEDASAGETLTGGHRLHRQWHAASNGDAVASIPIRHGGQLLAVIALRRGPADPFSKERLREIQARIEPLAPALVLARRAGRGLARHACESAGRAMRLVTRGGQWTRKIIAAVATICVAWFICGTIDYRLTVPCTVAPARGRHVSAPVDGVLASAGLVAGDRVNAGDVLCQFDASELTDQRAEMAAEMAVLEREADKARAENDAVNEQLATAKKKLVEARIAVLDNRIERATVRAPIAGAIVAGDLRKNVGGVLAKGDPLFEIAPLDELVLDLRVPEGDVDDLAERASGHFTPRVRPEQRHEIQVGRLRPAARVLKGKNVFVAEGRTKTASQVEWLRPGMEGSAVIEVGRRPVWWVVLHRAIDYVQFNVLP